MMYCMRPVLDSLYCLSLTSLRPRWRLIADLAKLAFDQVWGSSKFPTSQLFIGSCCPQLFNHHHLNTTCGCSMRKLMTNINWGQTINLRKKQQSVLIFHSQGLYLDFKPQSIDNFCLTFSGMFFFCSQISLIFVNFLQPHTAFNKEF